MNQNTQQLNETEQTALIAKIKQMNGENVSLIPYVMSSIEELAGVFKTIPPMQYNALIKTRNELHFMREHFTALRDKAMKEYFPLSALDDEEIINVSLTLAATEGILEILTTLQSAADGRLMEISPSIFTGGYNGKIN